MKRLLYGYSVFWLLLLVFVMHPHDAQATADTESVQSGQLFSTDRAGATSFVESTLLRDMHTLVSIDRRWSGWKWGAANELFGIYKEVSSCPSAAESISKMLIARNRNGVLTVLSLTNSELIRPSKSPITSTRQVKRIFVRAVQKAEKWESKREILKTFLNIFSLDGLTLAEKVTINRLQQAVEDELTIATASLEDVLLVLIEEVGNLSPLDETLPPNISIKNR